MDTPTDPGLVTREIYWNIWIPFRMVTVILLGLIPVAVIAWNLRARWLDWQKVGIPEPFPPRSEWPARAMRVVRHTLGQIRVSRRRVGGHAHVAYFYSFVVLFIGTVIVAIQADIATPLFDWYFFQGLFYRIYSATLEVAGVVGIVAVVLAIRERLKRPRTGGSGTIDWLPSLWWLLAVLITGFLVEAARISGTGFPEFERSASFVGYAIALLIPESAAKPIHLALWWGHFAISLMFLSTFGSHAMSHVFTLASNVFLARDIPHGATPRPIENIEAAETFGVLKVSQFRNSHLRDADVCVECGRCTEVCPAFNTGKPLSPRKIVNDVRDAWRAEFAAPEPPASLLDLVGADGRIKQEELWSCTTCGACERECPAMIEIVEKIVDMRRGLVLMNSDFPPEVQTMFNNLEQQGNPWGKPAEDRAKWTEDLPELTIPIMGEPGSEDAEYLFWVGCAGSYDARSQTITKSVARLMAKAGVKFAILGSRETCNGDSALRVGNEYLYQVLAKQNIETLRELKVRKVVVQCPHCFQTLAKDYRNMGLELEVVHHSELLSRLVAEGRIPSATQATDAVLHDSCYLARHNQIVDPPREVAKAALGHDVKEAARCKDKGFCCGAGGGRMWMEEHAHAGQQKVNVVRAQELLSTGANTVVTSCPFCKTMLGDGVKEVAGGKPVEVLDIAELLARGIDGGGGKA